MADAPGPPTLFGNPVSPGYVRKAGRAVRRYTRKYRYDPAARHPLGVGDHPVLTPAIGLREIGPARDGAPAPDFSRAVAIGTIRMGYGHYRIGIALASAARALGHTPLWFDLLAFESPGARLIRDLDYWYSLGSRLSQRSALFNRHVWEPLTANAYRRLEKNYPIMRVCELFTDVYGDLPRALPFLGTHPWPAQAAVFAGMENVVNAVPDNCPLGFHLAHGARHAVQSPSAYWAFRTLRGMGRPGQTLRGLGPDELRLAGHFVDEELVAPAGADCAARLARMADGQPRRLLISIGGAGAQQDLLIDLVGHILPQARAGRAALIINFGDHHRAWERFRAEIPELDAATHHRDWPAVDALARAAETGPLEGVHTVLQDDVFAAVYATNRLMRVCDALLTKPSELAYYPVPKIMLPRVGGHEAWGAIRAAELGDGSVECADAPACKQAIDLFTTDPDLLHLACERIPQLKAQGVYHGAHRAVEMAIGTNTL